MTGPKIDDKGECVRVDPASGLCRIDGIPVFKVIEIKGQMIRLQFFDDDKLRSNFRGSRLVEIPLDILFQRIIELSQ